MTLWRAKSPDMEDLERTMIRHLGEIRKAAEEVGASYRLRGYVELEKQGIEIGMRGFAADGERSSDG
jgi:hypothetical protein